MSDITWDDKDKNAPEGDPKRYFTDQDANNIKSAVNSKQDAVPGKGLSEFDYSAGDAARVANLPADTSYELSLKQDVSEKNQPNGYAGLDSTGIIPSTILPSYVDDVQEFANAGSFPLVGESGIIYLDMSTSPYPTQYRWSGSGYSVIVSSPGTTDALSEGSLNLYFTETRANYAVLVSGTPSNTPVAAGSSLAQNFYNVQGQIDAINAALPKKKTVQDITDNYIVTGSDIGKLLRMTSSGGKFKLPSDLEDVTIDIGFYVDVVDLAGSAFWSALSAPINMYAKNSHSQISYQYGQVRATKMASDTWLITGDTSL